MAEFARNAPSACRYTLSELAHLTGLTRTTARQLLQRYVPPGAENRFSFENLIELHVLHGLQRAYQPRKQALAEILAQLPQERPLLVIGAIHDIAGALASRVSVSASASFRAWLDRIEWYTPDAPSRLYPLYRATVETVEDVQRAPRLIAVDPHVRFGGPFLVNSGIPVEALVGCYRGGDSVNEIADDYKVAVVEVEEAIRYELETVG
jgi:uncharacterized protein (DUF433 family)